MGRLTVKRSVEAEKLENGYELSRQAFQQVHGRPSRLTEAESSWIMGWQSGFAFRRSAKGKKRGSLKEKVVVVLKEVSAELDKTVLATPTGNERNNLCDTNLHVLAAIDCISDTRGANQPTAKEKEHV